MFLDRRVGRELILEFESEDNVVLFCSQGWPVMHMLDRVRVIVFVISH